MFILKASEVEFSEAFSFKLDFKLTNNYLDPIAYIILPQLRTRLFTSIFFTGSRLSQCNVTWNLLKSHPTGCITNFFQV
jgi:hypothetical protein